MDRDAAREGGITASRAALGRARPPRRRSPAERLLEGRGWTFLRLAVDAALLVLAVLAALLGAPAGDPGSGGPLLWLFPPAALALIALRGLYGTRAQVRVLDGIGQLVGAISLAAISLVALAAFIGDSEDAAPMMARAWFFGTVYVAAGRIVLALNRRRARSAGAIGKPTLIVGAGQIGAQVERRLREQPELGLRPVGYLDADPAPEELVPDRGAPVLGIPSQLPRIVEETGAQHVVLAFLSSSDHSLVPLVRECERLGVEMSLVPRLFESMNVRVELDHIGGLPLFGLRFVDPRGWQFLVKHLFDQVVSGLLIVVLSPVLIAAAVAVKLSSPGPVFFRQRRIGRDGHEFEILKFRTMRGTPQDEGEANASWAASAAGGGSEPVAQSGERRTTVGRVLRRYSLDELPQLFNVLFGDMSLVGPRPELPHYVRLFEESVYRYGDRHRVKSGLTGWAQVHGLRGNTSLADRVEWDNYYIENWSLALDLKILVETVVAVLRPAE